MNVSSINSTPNFKGALNLEGPNPQVGQTVMTENISSVVPTNYLGKGLAVTEGSYIYMNNGSRVMTYLPKQAVVDAYKQAVKDGEATLKTPYDPIQMNKGVLLS